MLTPEQLNSLPSSVDEFIKTEPDRLTEIRQGLESYGGRLINVVRQISPEDVLDYQNYLHRQIPKEEREKGIADIKQSLTHDYIRDPAHVDPREIFFLSPFNKLEGKILTRLSIDETALAIWQRQQILRAMNHPFRTKIRRLYEEDLRRRYPGDKSYEPLPPMNSPFLEANADKELFAFDEFSALIKSGNKVSRQLAQAVGPYAVIGRHHVGIPIGSETMPDVVGNPIALATLVRCHAKAAAPRNNIFSDPRKQAELINETHKILEESRILEGRDDRQEILRQWDSNLGILVEPNAQKACHRIGTVIKSLAEGRKLGYVRIYMVEGADEMIETAQIIHKFFPDIEIDIGQVVNENQEREIQDLGCISSYGLGVTSGSRCSTAARAGIPGQNINQIYNIRKNGLKLPVFGETGIPHHALPVALACGLGRVNYSQGIIGWLDASGHEWGFIDGKTGDLLHLYDGEAGPKAKNAEERIYPWGLPIMLEGINGWSKYDPEFPTAAHRIWYLTESLILTDTFHRHLFHEDLIYDPQIEIVHLSEALANQVRPFDHF